MHVWGVRSWSGCVVDDLREVELLEDMLRRELRVAARVAHDAFVRRAWLVRPYGGRSARRSTLLLEDMLGRQVGHADSLLVATCDWSDCVLNCAQNTSAAFL